MSGLPTPESILRSPFRQPGMFGWRNRSPICLPTISSGRGTWAVLAILLLSGSLLPDSVQAQKANLQAAPSPISANPNSKDLLAKAAATERAYYTVCMNLIQRE